MIGHLNLFHVPSRRRVLRLAQLMYLIGCADVPTERRASYEKEADSLRVILGFDPELQVTLEDILSVHLLEEVTRGGTSVASRPGQALGASAFRRTSVPSRRQLPAGQDGMWPNLVARRMWRQAPCVMNGRKTVHRWVSRLFYSLTLPTFFC